ncbi:MAG: hypothetical protein M0P31_11020 [Solirubrobacteraceae bacterium]|nr:hypothetical protein [Solirubrobacteraceae bacterium]
MTDDQMLHATIDDHGPDDAGSAFLDAMFELLCEISDEAGIPRPERNVRIDVSTGEVIRPERPEKDHDPARPPAGR